jgi:hypothetical protein
MRGRAAHIRPRPLGCERTSATWKLSFAGTWHYSRLFVEVTPWQERILSSSRVPALFYGFCGNWEQNPSDFASQLLLNPRYRPRIAIESHPRVRMPELRASCYSSVKGWAQAMPTAAEARAEILRRCDISLTHRLEPAQQAISAIFEWVLIPAAAASPIVLAVVVTHHWSKHITLTSR